MYNNVHRTDNLSVNGLQWVVKESDKNSFKKLEQTKDISNILKAIISKRKLYSLRIEQFLSPKLRELTLIRWGYMTWIKQQIYYKNQF